ncbi:MAG: hypothetical protein ACOY3I_09100 [Verrucomicrobiota bacterium]
MKKLSKQRVLRGAVMDLGSNTFKLMLAEQRGKALIVHYETAVTTRLGENLQRKGKFSEKAIRRALAALKKFRARIEKFGAEKIIAVGTQALRAAKNRNDFLRPAEKILSIKIQIISGKKEGELVFAGISSEPRWRKAEILNIDLGGGSMEWIHGKNGKLISVKSIPIGCVQLRDLFFKKYPASPTQIAEAKKYLLKNLSPVVAKYEPFRGRLLSSGGTMNTLCSLGVRLTLSRFRESVSLTPRVLQKMERDFSVLTLAQLRKIPNLPKDRADIIVPGILILLTIVEILQKKHFSRAPSGLRYGVWYSKFSNYL